jgi:hypothetical protein
VRRRLLAQRGIGDVPMLLEGATSASSNVACQAERASLLRGTSSSTSTPHRFNLPSKTHSRTLQAPSLPATGYWGLMRTLFSLTTITAKIAAACRCGQELREFMYDPQS